MSIPDAEQLSLLAESAWEELIPLIFIVGVSIVTAITKALNKSDENAKSEKEKTNRLIEMAKRYKEMQETGRPRSVPTEEIPHARTERTPAERKPGMVSEWDRRQQEKKQQLARQRQMPQRPPRYVEPAAPPTFQPKQPEGIPVAKSIEPTPPVRPPYTVPKIQPKPRPQRASRRPQKREQDIPVAQLVELPRPKPAKPKRTDTRTIPAAQLSLFGLLKRKQSLRSAIILKEILDEPIGLREHW